MARCKRGGLVTDIGIRDRAGERPPFRHQPFIQFFAATKANCEETSLAIALGTKAFNAILADMIVQGFARTNPTRPTLFLVLAKLLGLRCVYRGGGW
jgi:hypothetical protein